VFELDALLHGTFGKRVVNLEDEANAVNFTSRQVPGSDGGPYVYTFVSWPRSSFKLIRPAQPPRPLGPATSSNGPYPLTVNGEYIWCGRGVWLYDIADATIANEFMACLTPRGRASWPSETTPLPDAALRLTPYGTNVEELDALLHETFGTRPVYLRSGQPAWATLMNDFSTSHVAQRSAATYYYTFANASRSMYQLRRPARPPRYYYGTIQSWNPFTIRGAYISCAYGWLYEPRNGQNENDFSICE
jgi:hypothetical protein